MATIGSQGPERCFVQVNVKRASIVAGLVSWGTAVVLSVVDITTTWTVPRWAYYLALSVAITTTAPFLSMSLQQERIERIVRDAAVAQAYKLALETLREAAAQCRADDDATAALPRVVGGDDLSVPTVPIYTKPRLIYNTADPKHRD